MKHILFVLFLVLITGCTTAYKPEGFGGGYTDLPLGGGKFSVTVRGNGVTGLKRVQDVALVRAAVIAQNEGDGFFLIIDNKQDTKVSASGSGSTNAYGNYSHSTQSYDNHYHTLVIKLIPAAKAEENDALSSSEIINKLGKEVGYR